MLIRHARKDDWADVVRIEQENFSPEEAATPEAIAERLETICDTFLIAEIDGVVVGYIEGPVIAERYLTDDLFHKVAPNASQKRQGISLTCHDYLIAYYEMNGFTDEGESESKHGGSSWYNMVWENPETH